MVRLSVNINKIATLRNARGEDTPHLITVAQDCERFGAQGITIHPRPDERHIRYDDIVLLKAAVKTPFNIEGYPNERFMGIIEKTRPAQATLVPDAADVLTSNAGWNTLAHGAFLQETVAAIQAMGVPVSLFVDASQHLVEGAAKAGAHSVELYTGPYAKAYEHHREKAVESYQKAALVAHEAGLGVNAGHDLNLDNLAFFKDRVTPLNEVSIGHALICDALYFGLENTIQMYLKKLV